MKEISPESAHRALQYQAFNNAPQPTVTVFKTVDVTRLYRLSRRNQKFNTMLCYCVGKAALSVPAFKLHVENKKLYLLEEPYAVSLVVPNKMGGINICEVPFTEDYALFARHYEENTARAYEKCENVSKEGSVLVGTSAMVETEIDGIVNLYSEAFNNPFLCWARYKKQGLRRKLPFSFQFHHVQMDGADACRFLAALEREVKAFSCK